MQHQNIDTTHQLVNQLVKITITNITLRSDAFAVNDRGELVYVSPSFVDRFGLKAGQEYLVKLIPNSPEHQARGTPWRVYFIETQAPKEIQSLPKADKRNEKTVLAALVEVEMLRAGDVVKLTGLTSAGARDLMDKLHAEGKVVRADIWRDPTQSHTSLSVWALDDATFAPLEG